MKLKMWKRLMAFSMAVVLLAGSVNLTSIAADTTEYYGDAAQEGEIATGTYQENLEAFYGTATFYDYYSVPELDGVALSKNPFSNGYGYDAQALDFNQALSDYYKQNGYTTSNYPLYVGASESYPNDIYALNSLETVNGWTNDAYLALGMADSTTKDGTLTQNGVAVPYFDEGFLRGNNSLNASIGQVYSNVKFPFTKNSSGYWEYNSYNQSDNLELRQDVTSGYYLETRTNPIYNSQHNTLGFYPLEQYASNKNYSAYFRNNMFGMHMDIEYHMTENGEIITENGIQPVTFEFAGDDDVWIFIDGVLVLDVGGIHGSNGGKINFKTGEVTYNSTYYDVIGKQWVTTATNLKDLQTAAGTSLYDSVHDGEKHKISIYFLERGLYDSNLKILFNFPVYGKFTVQNTVDTSAANQAVFGDALSHLGSFDYYLYNQAVSGQTLAVEDAAGYIKVTAAKEVVSGDETTTAEAGVSVDNEEEDNLNLIHYISSLETPNVSDWKYGTDAVNKRLATIPIDEEDAFVIDGTYAYLYTQVKSSAGSASGHKFYIQLNYSDGTTWGNTADLLTYNNSSNGIFDKVWTEIRLSLADAPQGNVTSISFAYMEKDAVVHINKIIAYGPWDENTSTGFAVDQALISDYKSISSVDSKGNVTSKLMPASSAFFEKVTENTSNIARVGELGTFGLANGQSAVFTDKFRFGSYIYLREVLTDDQKIFDTTYTILEGKDGVYEEIPSAALAADRTDTTTITNSGSVSSLTDIEGRVAADGRTSIINNTAVAVDDTEIPMYEENAIGKTLVFRNYSNPDTVEGVGVDLKVDYVNVLRVGSVTVKKVLQWTDADGDNKDDTSDLDWETFKSVFIKSANKEENENVIFRMTFTNIAGRYLETELGYDVTTDLVVYFSEFDDTAKTITGTATLDGIPAGTQYKIEEIQVDGMHLVGIGPVEQETDDTTRMHTLLGDNSSGVGGSDDEAYAEAIAYESNAIYTFKNQFTYFTDIVIEKQWDDSVTKQWAEASDAIAQVTVELQRRILGGAWEKVELPVGTTDTNPQTTVSLKTTFDGLPTVDENKNRYEYRVVEVAVHAAMGDVNDYIIFYITKTDGTLVVINASSNRTYYVENAVKRELPILPDGETNKQSVYNTYDIQILDTNDNDVVGTLFEILTDGTINYTAPSIGIAMYDVIFTSKENSSDVQKVKVAIYAYDAVEDTYILDYGKDVLLADHNQPGQSVNGSVDEAVLTNGMFANDVYNAVQGDTVSHEIVGVVTAEAAEEANMNGVTVVYGKSAADINGKITLTRVTDESTVYDSGATDVVFTPTKFMNSVDMYLYKTIIRSAKATGADEAKVEAEPGMGVVMTAEVNILPANNVYYEDTFVTDESTGTVGIVYSGNWITDGTFSGNTEKPNGTIHGWEESLADDTGYSDGSAHMSSTPGAGVTFTFTGTGVDVYSRTNQDSGIIMGMLYEGTSTNQVAMRFVMMDNLAKNGDYYQVPTLSFSELDYGEYTVKIIVSKPAKENRANYYLDGIRVYNPLADTENSAYGDEKNAVYAEVRDCLEANNGDLTQGEVFIDADNDGKFETKVMDVLEVYGPKNEIYLSQGQAVAFVVNYDANARYQVGLKSLTGAKLSAMVAGEEITVGHTTDLYYKITTQELSESSNVVIIKNQSEGVLAITKLKVTNATQISSTSVFSLMREEALVEYAMSRDYSSSTIEEETETQIENLDIISDKLMKGLNGWF